jgi:beta-galactosidase
VTLALLMHGVKGFNLYMTVERDRWIGAPVGAEGQRRQGHFERTQRLVTAVRGTGPAEPGIASLERRVPVAVVQVRDYERLTVCTALTDPFPPAVLDLLDVGPEEVCSEETFGLSGPVARQYGAAFRLIAAALARSGIPHHVVDSDLPLERLARYPILLVPSFDFMDQQLLERLSRYVEGGGQLLLTPRPPRLDSRTMRPLADGLPDHTLVEDAAGLESALQPQIERLGLTEPTAEESEVELTLHRMEDRPCVLFVANRSARPLTSAVHDLNPYPVSAWDALEGSPVDLQRIRLDSHQVRMIRLKSPEQPGGETEESGQR